MKKAKQYLKSSKRSGVQYLMIVAALAGSSQVWGANVSGGIVTIAQGAADTLTGATTLTPTADVTASNGITLSGHVLTIAGTYNTTISGAISGTAVASGLTKNGAGTLTISSGSNDIRGVVDITGGKLVIGTIGVISTDISTASKLYVHGGDVDISRTAGTNTQIAHALQVSNTGLLKLITHDNSIFETITLDDGANLQFDVNLTNAVDPYTGDAGHGKLVVASSNGLTTSGTADITLKLDETSYSGTADLTLIDEGTAGDLTALIDPSKFNITVKNTSGTSLDMLARVKRNSKKLIVLLNDTDFSGEFTDGYFTTAVKDSLKQDGVTENLLTDTLKPLRDHLRDAKNHIKSDANLVSTFNGLAKHAGTDADLLRTLAKQVAPTANHGLIAPAPTNMCGANGAGTNPMPPSTGFMSKMMKQGFSKRQVAEVSSLRNFAVQTVQGIQGAVYAQETGKRDASFYANQIEGLSAWGEYNHQSGKNYIADLDETTKYSANRGTLGISNTFSQRVMIGASIASRDTNMNLDTLGSKNDVQSTIVSVFGSFRPENSDWYGNGSFAYSGNKNDKTAILVVGGTTYTKAAKPKSHDLNFSAEIGYDYNMKSFGILSPYVGVSLTSTHEDGYTETGTGMTYEYKEREFSTNDWSLGIRTSKVYTDAKLTYIMDGGVGFYTSKACKDGGIINYRIPGAASYTTSTINPDRYDYLDLNAGLTMQYNKSVQTALIYHGMFGKDDNKLNEFTARVEYTF